MPEKIGIKVDVPHSRPKDVPPIERQPTLEGVIAWIQSKGLDPETEEKIIKKVKRRPFNTLEAFLHNFSKHVQSVRKVRKSDK